METRRLIELLQGTIDPNLRQQAEDELEQVRNCLNINVPCTLYLPAYIMGSHCTPWRLFNLFLYNYMLKLLFKYLLHI